MIEITESMLDDLRAKIRKGLSEKRFFHVAEVEKMTARLCALFCPAETMKMRAAALLHDVTKEKNTEEQKELFQIFGLPFTQADELAPKTLHARSAAALIPSWFPQFADATVIQAVRWHTTGHANMTLTEKLLYLADYIDNSRTFEACVALREMFWGAEPEKMNPTEREQLLREVLLASYHFTMRDLLEEGRPIARETVDARNELLLEMAEKQK